MIIYILYLFSGVVAGLLAGLLGIGGGLVIVPLLNFCMELQGVPEDLLMRMPLGTSMATIVFTSVSSFMAHNRRGAVDWSVVRRITIGILVGTFLGTVVASHMNSTALKICFTIFLFTVCAQMLSGKKPKPSRHLPGMAGMSGAGGAIGLVSGLVGIGGGTLIVPFLTWCNVNIHRAVGTSAAIGFPIAVTGAVGYIINGWNAPGLPPYSLGFVYLPALALVAGMSMMLAPVGAKISHNLPVERLKRFFAVILILTGIRMLYALL